MKTPSILILAFLILLGNSQDCAKFEGMNCVACVQGKHLHQGQCVSDIANCKLYSATNGVDCTECKEGFKLESNVCYSTASIDAQYKSFKYIKKSTIQALSDINYIIALNYVAEQVKELKDQTPLVILVQQGFDNPKIAFVRYVLNFEVINNENVKVVYQVLVKVAPSTGKVVIDSLRKREAEKVAQNAPKPAQVSEPKQETKPTTQLSLQNKASYEDITKTVDHNDVRLLKFLEASSTAIEEILQQAGLEPSKIQVVFLGRIDKIDFLYFWVEIQIEIDGESKVLVIKGYEDKADQQVTLTDMSQVKKQEEKQSVEVKESAVPKNNVEVPSSVQKAAVPQKQTEEGQKIQEKLQENTPQTTSQTKPSTPSATEFNLPSIQSSVNVQIKEEKQVLSQASNIQNVITDDKLQAPKQAQTLIKQAIQQTINASAPFDKIEDTKEVLYQHINQLISSKLSGFSAINPDFFEKDEGLMSVVDSMLKSSSSGQLANMKLYQAYVKGYALKSDYKLFFIDQVSAKPQIILYEGFATYDYIKGRVYMLYFNQLLY